MITSMKKVYAIVVIGAIALAAYGCTGHSETGHSKNDTDSLPQAAMSMAEEKAKELLKEKHKEVRDWKTIKTWSGKLTDADAANGVTDRRFVMFAYVYRDPPSDPPVVENKWSSGELQVTIERTHDKWKVVFITGFGGAIHGGVMCK